MKKLVFVCLLMVALLGVALVPALANPVAEVTALSKYFPEGTVVFAALRTDDDYLRALDGLVSKVIGKLPQGIVPPGISLKPGLDLVSQQATQKSFAEGIRPWLGDTAAFGLTSLEGMNTPNTPILIAVDLADRSAAEAFLDKLAPLAQWVRKASGDNTLYTDKNERPGGGALLVTDDALLVGANATIVEGALKVSSPLTNGAKFKDTLALLPINDYNIVAYADLGTLFAEAMKMSMSNNNMSAEAQAMQEAFLGVLGTQAYAFTLLDERSLVVDVVSKPRDLSKLTAMGLKMPNIQPVNLKFAANLPADASLVMHGSSIKTYYDFFLQTMRASQPAAMQEEMEKGLEQAKAQIKAATGLDLDKDILDWMTGDFAAFVSLDMPAIMDAIEQGMQASASGGSSGTSLKMDKLPFGFGFVAQATDPAKAKALADALGKVLPTLPNNNPEVKISQETISGVQVTVISQMMPMGTDQKLPLDIVIGANDKVFLIATRAAAEAIFGGKPGLDSTAAFQEAGKYLLQKPNSVLYSDGQGAGGTLIIVGLALLGPAIGGTFDRITDGLSTPTAEQKAAREAARKRQEEQNRQIVAALRTLITLSSSSSISSETIDPATGASRVRFVLTLAP
jgi:hypothetical protein